MNKPLSPALQKLLADFGNKLPEKLEELRALHLSSDAPEETALREFYTAVHKLAGSSGSYGYPQVSQCARLLDRYLSDVLAGETSYAPDTASSHLDALAEIILKPQQD